MQLSIDHLIQHFTPDGSTAIEVTLGELLRIKKRPIQEAVEWFVNIAMDTLLTIIIILRWTHC